MLTLNQKEKLQPLILHPRFGKLLIDAIDTWEVTNPAKGDFGIIESPLNDLWILDSRSSKTCCLIGASLLNKTAYAGGFSNTAANYFSLPFEEIGNIIAGFDNGSISYGRFPESYEFGKSVSNIVFDLS